MQNGFPHLTYILDTSKLEWMKTISQTQHSSQEKVFFSSECFHLAYAMLQQRLSDNGNYFGWSSMGHIISDKGVATDPEKIKAVQEWPVPINQTEIQSFL